MLSHLFLLVKFLVPSVLTYFSVWLYLPFFSLQEEIKITGVTVFVNPYTEPDEEDEKEKEKEEKIAEDEDNVSLSPVDLESLRSTYTDTGKRTPFFKQFGREFIGNTFVI